MGKSKQGFFADLGAKISDTVNDLLGGVTFDGGPVVTESVVYYGNGPSVRGEGEVESELRPVVSFDRIRSSLMGDVVITVGGERTVEVQAQQNLLEHVETLVENGELVLRMRSGSYTSTRRVCVSVTMPTLNALVLTGHGDTRATNVDARHFRLAHAGLGDVSIQGTIHDLSLDLTGHGNVDLSELAAVDIMLKHTGMGDLDLHSNGTVTGTASGHGDVTLRGGGAWRVRHTGMGDVKFR